MVSVHAIATYHRCCILCSVNYLIKHLIKLIRYCKNIAETHLNKICLTIHPTISILFPYNSLYKNIIFTWMLFFKHTKPLLSNICCLPPKVSDKKSPGGSLQSVPWILDGWSILPCFCTSVIPDIGIFPVYASRIASCFLVNEKMTGCSRAARPSLQLQVSNPDKAEKLADDEGEYVMFWLFSLVGERKTGPAHCAVK